MDSIGRYRIVKEIGRGAMGIVYLATDPTIGRSVAIKTVRLRDVDNTQQRDKLRERLFREARSAGVLSHPNIVTIYDMAEEDGVAYIAMEYVDGPTLDDLMNANRPLESGKIFGILRQTATALDYAHTKGIVHRDIKPANIMLGRDGNIKVTDFGIAKINAAADSFTMTGTLVGTPNYMSPEQVQGNEATGRSDQFSLAVIAYEILTGERPFPGAQLSTVVYKIVAEEPVSPQKLNSTLGPYIDGVLRKALSKKPPNRYRTCAEFVGSLETTCAATKGWKPVVRGASLNMSTMTGVVPPVRHTPIPDPPARKGRAANDEDQTASANAGRGEPRKESRILPLAAAILMVTGVVSLLTWHGGEKTSAGQVDTTQEQQPTRSPTSAPPEAKPAPTVPDTTAPSSVTPAPPSEPEPKAAGESPESAASEAPKEEAPKPALKPEITKPSKPSPLGPVERSETKASPPAVVRPAPPRIVGKPQELSVPTNPPGATLTVDGGESCVTPCTLQVAPGLHSISVRLDGYQEERREVHIGTEAEMIPLISLRKAAGTLMITSDPPGATITINNKVQSQMTPATINLPPGTYTVKVEKDGKSQTDRVEIRNGNTNLVRIPLD